MTVAHEGWSPVGVLDGHLSRRLLRAVHRRRDNLGTRIRRAIVMAYSYRWLTSRDVPLEDVPEWAGLAPIRRQLLGDRTVDPFYWASGGLPLDPGSTDLHAA